MYRNNSKVKTRDSQVVTEAVTTEVLSTQFRGKGAALRMLELQCPRAESAEETTPDNGERLSASTRGRASVSWEHDGHSHPVFSL